MSATRIHVDGIVLVISLLFASLLFLLSTSVYILYADIGLNLTTNVTERLDDEGFQFYVEFDGRDGFVSGSVKDDATKKEVISIAKSVEGVRTIENELTILDMPKENGKNNLDGLSDVSDAMKSEKENKLVVKSLNEIATSTVPTPTFPDPNIEDYQVEEGKKSEENLTEITEKVILEDFTINFKAATTALSAVDKISLSLIAEKLKDDALLFVEMSSFHLQSKVAIKRTEIIKDFLIENGSDKKHFDVLWHDSEDKNQVQLKLFRNE
jgi:hypothetical protein